ncbi:MAG: HAMP domain-containing sensor histidine kinase [Candidatus Hydrogenedentota bacterium]
MLLSDDVLKSRLGRRIVLLIMLAGLLPLLLFALPIHFETKDIFTEEARSSLEGQAQLAADHIVRTLELAEARLREASARPVDPGGIVDPFRRIALLDRNFQPRDGAPPFGFRVLDDERKRQLLQGRPVLTPAYLIENTTTATVIVPLKNGDYIEGELDPYRFWEITRGTLYGPSDVFRVMDLRKRVLASSLSHVPLGVPPGLEGEWQLPQEPRRSGTGPLEGLNSIIWVFQEIRSPLFPEQERWGVLITRKADAAREFETRLLKSLLLLFLLALAVLTLLALRVARNIQGPISDLARTTRALGDGDWTVRSRCANDDEIGDLARAFNRMAEDIRRTHESQIRLEGEAVVGRLASQVAHEVNNPLAAIKTWISHLRKLLPADERIVVSRLDDQINRIARTVKSLLNFSRQRQMRHEKVPISSLLDVIASLFHASFRGAGVHFLTDVPENLPPLSCDADQIQEVIINLLENARAAVAPGGMVRLSAAEVMLEGNKRPGVRIVIENDGPGLGDNPEIVFRPFYTTKTTGTGLGLTLSRRICEEHGGTLHGENREAGGARFVIRIPCASVGPAREEMNSDAGDAGVMETK